MSSVYFALVGGNVHDWKTTRLARRVPVGIEGLASTVVSSHKGVAVGAPLLPVDVLFRLLECDVHVAVNRLKLAWVWSWSAQDHVISQQALRRGEERGEEK